MRHASLAYASMGKLLLALARSCFTHSLTLVRFLRTLVSFTGKIGFFGGLVHKHECSYGMEDKLNELELQLEDMATHMIFAQMTIQQADSDLLQREDTLQEVHKMRAGERVG